MTTPRPLPDGTGVRSYGFDVDTAYSSPRGNRFERGTTFGHTGFTGTSMWIDPVNDLFVVLLTNSVHPEGKGKAVQLRRLVSTAVAEALLGPGPATQPATRPTTRPGRVGNVATGIDVLKRGKFEPLKGKRVAVVTNHSGLDRVGNRTLDLLIAAEGVKVVKVFSPEHGLYGVLDEKVSDAVDPKTGLKVYSLYGKTNKP
jgi:hypothetical protein